MNQHFFILELAHAHDGQIKRIQVSYKAIGYVFLSLAALSVLVFAGCGSYLRMTWKVSNYEQLRADFEHLRTRYQDLQRVSGQRSEQMVSLESLASEVTVVYGLNSPAKGRAFGTIEDGEALTPNMKESLAEYNFLTTASYSGIYHQYAHAWQANARPSLWPVEGIVRSAFGTRSDPFSGEGAFHTGIDVAASRGNTSACDCGRSGFDGRLGRRLRKVTDCRPWEWTRDLLCAPLRFPCGAGAGSDARTGDCLVGRHRKIDRAARAL